MSRVNYTAQQLVDLNRHQFTGKLEPLTCQGHNGCPMAANGGGLLIATQFGWECPCGRLTRSYGQCKTEQHVIEEAERQRKFPTVPRPGPTLKSTHGANHA